MKRALFACYHKDMWELIALAVYSVQWLGIVLGVGAQVVVMVAHLSALHEHKPQWLAAMPAVNTVQRWGLGLIIGSGIAAVGFQALVDASVFAIPVFWFKWQLIALAWGCFAAVRFAPSQAWVEGFAGGTWLALFAVHSVAPVGAGWLALEVSFAVWVTVFGALWFASIYVMGRGAHRELAVARTVSKRKAQRKAPSPVIARTATAPTITVSVKEPIHSSMPMVPKPAVAMSAPVLRAPEPAALTPKASKPLSPIPAPLPIAPAPIQTEHAHTTLAVEPAPMKPSFWQRLLGFFAHKDSEHASPVVVEMPQPPQPKQEQKPIPSMAAASAPVSFNAVARVAPRPEPAAAPTQPAPAPAVQKPQPHANLPVVEHLELMPPATAPVAASAPEAAHEPDYVPDWNSIPGLRVMPQKPEDLSKENRAPLVQAAA